jgi:hypothetical protein
VEFFVVELMIVVLMIDACLVHTNTNSFHDMLYYLIVVHFIILNIMAFVKFRNYHLIPFHSSFIVSFQQIQQITTIKTVRSRPIHRPHPTTRSTISRIHDRCHLLYACRAQGGGLGGDHWDECRGGDVWFV